MDFLYIGLTTTQFTRLQKEGIIFPSNKQRCFFLGYSIENIKNDDFDDFDLILKLELESVIQQGGLDLTYTSIDEDQRMCEDITGYTGEEEYLEYGNESLSWDDYLALFEKGDIIMTSLRKKGLSIFNIQYLRDSPKKIKT